jgi:hypothetical protein
MVDLHPFGDRSNEQLIDNPMGVQHSLTQPDLAIARIRFSTPPKPTGIGFLHLWPEAILKTLHTAILSDLPRRVWCEAPLAVTIAIEQPAKVEARG